jgi:hypothetical protein
MPANKRLGQPLIVMLGVIIALVAFAVPASAAPYTNPATTSVSNQNPVAGATLTFCGQGFLPGETVAIALDTGAKYPSVVTDSSGAFCTTVVLGATLTGTHAIVATGVTSGRTSSTVIHVAAASASGQTGGLAFTGAAVIGIGALGGLLLVGGAIMVLAGRRRRVNA